MINRKEFKEAVISSLGFVIASPIFEDMVRRNWSGSQGNEEEIYPYFTESLRRSLGGVVIGIGPGKIKDQAQKVDCFVDLSSVKYAVELKGPSKSYAYVSGALSSDFKKLSSFVSNSHIDHGIAIGIFIEKTTLQSEYQRVFMVDGTSIGIRIEVMETQ